MATRESIIGPTETSIKLGVDTNVAYDIAKLQFKMIRQQKSIFIIIKICKIYIFKLLPLVSLFYREQFTLM